MAAAVTAAALALSLTPAFAQLPLAPASAPPDAISSGVTQHGDLLTAPVTLDGGLLFRVASLLDPLPGQIPAGTRATSVEAALSLALAIDAETRDTIYDPASMKIGMETHGNERLLTLTDTHHTSPLPIVTVTTIDSRFYQDSVPAVAADWQATLQTQLQAALERRQPEALRQSFTKVVAVGLVLTLLTAAMLWWRLRTLEKAQLLEERSDPQTSRDDLSRAAVLRARTVWVAWIATALWIAALAWAFYQFPQTMSQARSVVRTALSIVIIWVIAIIADRVLGILIRRGLIHLRPGIAPMTATDSAREHIRVPTVIAAINGFETFLVMTIAVFATLTQLGIQVTSVITFGGLAAIALSFAAQNLLRDFLSGVLVILEDQYAVGDAVTINGTTGGVIGNGVVEAMTLRMVQLRDLEGSLITFGHGSVAGVTNRTRNWSRVDFRIAVDVDADIAKAIALVRDAIVELAKDPVWAGMLIPPSEWIGVDAIGRDGIVIRGLVRTEPNRQFEVNRELNLKVLEAMRQAGIQPGVMPANLSMF